MIPLRKRSSPLLALGMAAALAGCGNEKMEAELASLLYAAPVATTPVATVDAGEALPAERAPEIPPARRVFSRGAADGDERYLFGQIADVATSSGGDTVYVLDRMERRVKAFDAAGEFLFDFGRGGDGPGEYQSPSSLVTLPWNGRLAVWDWEQQRLTILTPQGKVVETLRPLAEGKQGVVRTGQRLRAYRDGFVIEVRSDPLTVPPSRQRGYMVRLDTLGQARDTVLDFAVPTIEAEQRTYGTRSTSYHWSAPPHFTPRPTWDAFPDGSVAFVPGGPYEIYRVGADRSVRRVTRPWTPRAITRRERMINLRESQERGQYGQGIPMLLLEAINRKYFAAARPMLSGALALEDGGVAARRFDVDDEWEGRSRTWDEYAPAGAPRGSLRYPAG
ncbi:MAG TPA: 6-bladed beta-propeller, partial [Longimicrobiaceae bacterium]|nr:6-bladed beta-propeller [Longimicrobiaceae bacterium]